MTLSLRSNRGLKLTRLQRHSLRYECDRLLKAAAGRSDKFDAHDQEQTLRAGLYSAWQSQLHVATQQIGRQIASNTLWKPSVNEVHGIMQALNSNLSSHALASRIASTARATIGDTISIGKESVNAMYRKQTGTDPVKKDAPVSFGIIFGLTEDHALQALTDQITIAAGGFWDDQLSDSIRKEMESWFSGDISRQDLIDKLKKIVNDRLSIEGKASLPGSYFDGLAEHYIVRARNIGSVYQGKSLGAHKYAIVNPRDHRTSEICSALSKPGLYFTMVNADKRVSDILGARSQDDLKAVAPFLTSGTASSESAPVPPLHWRCRSWMKFIF